MLCSPELMGVKGPEVRPMTHGLASPQAHGAGRCRLALPPAAAPAAHRQAVASRADRRYADAVGGWRTMLRGEVTR